MGGMVVKKKNKQTKLNDFCFFRLILWMLYTFWSWLCFEFKECFTKTTLIAGLCINCCFVCLFGVNFLFFIFIFVKHTNTRHTHKYTKQGITLRTVLRDNTYTQHAKLSATAALNYALNMLKSVFSVKGMLITAQKPWWNNPIFSLTHCKRFFVF